VPTSRATRVTSQAKGVELVHHGIDGVFQFENFAAHVDIDLTRKVAARDGGGDFGDTAHLIGQVARHRVDVVGQILPGAGDAGHDRLSAELAFGADLACDARHLRCEGAQLVDHDVDGFLELVDFTAHVDGNFLRQVAVRDRDGHFRNISDLRRQIVCHRVDVLGKVLPHTGHLAHLGLAAELALGADLARDARHFRREDAELFDHAIDDIGRAEEFALEGPPVDFEPHRLQQVALRDGRCARDRGGRPQQVVDQVLTHFSISRPTALLTSCSCIASCSLAITTSLNVSAILPANPVRSPGSRTEKSPLRTDCSAVSRSASCISESAA
jgi:hypothetical protein